MRRSIEIQPLYNRLGYLARRFYSSAVRLNQKKNFSFGFSECLKECFEKSKLFFLKYGKVVCVCKLLKFFAVYGKVVCISDLLKVSAYSPKVVCVWETGFGWFVFLK